MANLSQLGILESLDGFLLVDKPAGLAFSTVVKAVKRKFNLVKVGHGGSLDAAASGLLVLMIGDSNKFTGDVMGADRAYEGRIRFGLKTNTGDVQGADIARSGAVPTAEALAKALPEFKGDVFEVEPRYCAVRKEGSAAYEIADTGDHTQFLAHVYRFAIEAPVAGETVSPFTLRASKGVLVRALASDLGDALGCGAALESCRRTAQGNFKVEDAIPFDKLLEVEPKDFPSLVVPPAKAPLS